MFATRVEMNKDKLTTTDQKIVDYLIIHHENVSRMTSYQLSALLQIGQSNIIRLSQKLGYTGFRDLQFDLNNMHKEENDAEILFNDSTEVVNQKIAYQYYEIVKTTESINETFIIEKAVTALFDARRIIVHGIGNSQLFAEYFANHLLKMGCDAQSSSNNHIINTLTSNLSTIDVLVLISETGETPEILQLASLAQTKKVKTISLTRMTENSLSKLSHIVLKTCNDLSGSRLNAMTIRCSQLYLIDLLCLNLIKKDITHFTKKIEQSEKLLNTKE